MPNGSNYENFDHFLIQFEESSKIGLKFKILTITDQPFYSNRNSEKFMMTQLFLKILTQSGIYEFL